MVWYGLVEIPKLNSRPLINHLMTRVGIELLGQLKNIKNIAQTIIEQQRVIRRLLRRGQQVANNSMKVK